MKKLVLFFIISLSCITMKSQALVFPGSEWHYGYGGFNFSSYAYLKYDRDTIIQDTAAYVITKRVYNVSLNSLVPNSIDATEEEYVYTTESQVYRFVNGQFELLYDLNANVGDTLITHYEFTFDGCPTEGQSIVDSVGVFEINDLQLNFIRIKTLPDSELNYDGFVIERIGVVKDDFISNNNYGFLFPKLITCLAVDVPDYSGIRCYNDDEFSYVNPDFNDDCEYVFTGINEVKKQNIQVFPNPSSGRFVVELPVLRLRSATFALSVIDALGVTVFSRYDVRGNEFEIDLTGFADGIYMVQLIGGVHGSGPSTGSGTYDRVYVAKIVKR
ncbi:MAG: hypothetical protein ACI8XB_002049 [Patiriisocius sp.]|jgi:hypothetical protein